MYERPLIPTKSLSNVFDESPEKGHLHIIVWHPFPTELSLSYWIIGDDPKNKHSVTTNSNQRVEYLRQAIKAGHKGLEYVDAAKLKLWQVTTKRFTQPFSDLDRSLYRQLHWMTPIIRLFINMPI